jgi:hypothetical protein
MPVPMPVPLAVPAMSPAASASASGGAGEEVGEEGMELGDPVLRDVDRDLLVLRRGFGIRIHFRTPLFAYASKHSRSKYLSKESFLAAAVDAPRADRNA